MMPLISRRWSHAIRAAVVAFCAATFPAAATIHGSETEVGQTAGRFDQTIRPLLQRYCWDCHADGAAEGNRAFDAYGSDDELLSDRKLWWAVLKNVRADIMPPGDADRPTADEKRILADWIQRDVFGVDPDDPDPGQVTIRRLNREEYRNTVRDLMGVDYDTLVEFPPDDSGHGFDNVGDVLSLSPLLLEKYLHAAGEIVDEAVPRVSRVLPVRHLGGDAWRSSDGEVRGERLDFYKPVVISRTISVEHPAEYRLRVNYAVNGGFDFDPGTCRFTCRVDGRDLWTQELAWAEERTAHREHKVWLESGDRSIEFELEPLTAIEAKKHDIHLRLRDIQLEGPLDQKFWEAPRGYERFFTRSDPPPPDDEEGRTRYARDLLRDFGLRAFRRPVDEPTLDRLVSLSRAVDNAPDRSFEDSIAAAMTAMLASPRFLFRFESPVTDSAGSRFPLVDEYALASRLSYFLWSTMPDQELLDLAARGELRQQLDQQLTRMLRDDRSNRLIGNFVGQWLQTRDVEGASIDPLAAMGMRQEYDELRETFFRSRRFRSREPQPDEPPEITAARERMRVLREIRDGWNEELRRAMRRETELLATHIVREDRSLLDLIDCDYTFLNERLAKHYGIEGVSGDEMQRVSLAPDSPRGGILTQGSFLVVTSNPTRTSPVKRGLFILDNLLGTPAPPAPAQVPELEESKEQIADHEPTLREALELHRRQPLCRSCHARFDPLGLALENYNAMAMWRDTEAGQSIDPSGKLITGESFTSVEELKSVLKNERRLDFYRCVSEKMLTYALGRGMEPEDDQTLDRIVSELDASGGRVSVLIRGIVLSAPLQRMRPPTVESAAR